MACLFHQLSFPLDWRWYNKGILLSIATLFVLFKPSSWQRLALLIIVDWISVGWEFPFHPNHIVFSWVVNGTLLTSLIMVATRNKVIGRPDLAPRWFEAFAPWVRIELCILYFFAVFHKLNVAYFDPGLSCAAKLYLEINDRFPLLPVPHWTLYAAIYGTLIIEVAIPLLLFFPRTRAGGIILGLLFHGLLALHGHVGLFSFSATMIPLFTTFLPSSVAEALRPNETIRKAWRWILFILGALLLAWISRDLLPSSLRLEDKLAQNWKVGFLGFFAYLGFSLILFVRILKITWNDIQTPVGSWKTHPGIIGFILILVINGFGPYFGLKSVTSFSMFSNLHTENGMTNHLIMPSGIQITNWQYDVVEIIDSNEPGLIQLRDNGLLVIFLELRRRRTSASSDLWVTFRRNGKNETFDMKRPETYGVLPALNPLAKRYFYFRSIDRDPKKARCQW